MKKYTKEINGIFQTSIEKFDDTWVEVVFNDKNEVVSPLGLATQINNELQTKMDNVAIKQKLEYLKDTDWYYARLAETGEEIPQDVKDKRVQAREFLRSKGY